jgi:hypothetical protein
MRIEHAGTPEIQRTFLGEGGRINRGSVPVNMTENGYRQPARGDTSLLSVANLKDFTGFDFRQGENTGREVLAKMRQTVGSRPKNYHCNFSTREVLLILKIGIQGDEGIKTWFRKTQKFAVLLSRPIRFLNGGTFVSVTHEMPLEGTRSTFVNQNPHLIRATRLRRASSIAAMASSRLTLGYSSRN